MIGDAGPIFTLFKQAADVAEGQLPQHPQQKYLPVRLRQPVQQPVDAQGQVLVLKGGGKVPAVRQGGGVVQGLAAALLPPLILLAVVYRMDRLEKEPARLLWSLFFRGLLGMFPILILELVADQFIDFFPWDPMTYLFLAYFVVPGFIEEGVKNRVLRKRTWYDPNFNYRFDGIVYGVFVSLGFAGVENVLYVLNAGFGTAVVRAIFSIPGHAMFGVVMGFYLSRAKWAEKYGQRHRMRADLRRSFFVPAVLHGLYDFLLMGFETVFYFYFAGLVIGVICLLRKSAREDGPI